MIRGRRVLGRIVESLWRYALRKNVSAGALEVVLRGIAKVHCYMDIAYVPSKQQLVEICSSGVKSCSVTATGVVQFYRDNDVLLFSGGKKSRAALESNYENYTRLTRDGFADLVDYPLERLEALGAHGYSMGLLSPTVSDATAGCELLSSFGVGWVENQYSTVDFSTGLSFIKKHCSELLLVHEMLDPKPEAGYQGLVHGDLTASNIMVNRNGSRVLIDLDRFIFNGPVVFDELHAQISCLEEQGARSWLEFIHEYFSIDGVSEHGYTNNLLWAYFLFRVGHESAIVFLPRYAHLVRIAAKRILMRRSGVIGFVTPYVGNEAGGVGKVVSCLMASMHKVGGQDFGCVRVISTYKEVWSSRQVVLIHSHGLWSLLHVFAFAVALWRGLPYVVSPHGMLDPAAMKQKSTKKILAWYVYQRFMLKSAAAILVNSEREALQVKKIGCRQALYVLANGVDFPKRKFKERELPVKRALFLSRISPVKGIKELLLAWAKSESVRFHGYQLDIYGNVDDPKYMGELIAVREAFHLQESVCFKGAVYGEDKWNVYRSYDFFILPSHGENFGIVVAEALFAGLPVITTKWTPWSQLEGLGFGLEAQDLEGDLVRVINCLVGSIVSHGVSDRMSEAQEYVINLYSWDKIAAQYFEVYREVLAKKLPSQVCSTSGVQL